MLLRNRIFLLVITIELLVSYPLTAQYLWQISNDTVIRWNYYSGDEFNKNAVDETKWLLHLPWSRAVVSQDIYYLDTNTSIGNGYVKFALNKVDHHYKLQEWEKDTVRFKKEDIKLLNGEEFPFKYTGGLLWSKERYKYGYFEIKFKAPLGQGIWPAFWLYGGDPNNEIDFFELKGEKQKSIHVDIHCKDGCSNYKKGMFGYKKAFGHWVDMKENLSNEYAVISGEWTPDHIKWFFNGKLIAFSDVSINISMNLTAGTGIGKEGGAFDPGPNSKTPFPNLYNVDYIRVYKADTVPNYNEIYNVISPEDNSLDNTQITLFNIPKQNLKKGDYRMKDKPGALITLSVMQQTKNIISVRALNVSNNAPLSVTLTDELGVIIKTLLFIQNDEIIVRFNNCRSITIDALVGSQIIHESITIQ